MRPHWATNRRSNHHAGLDGGSQPQPHLLKKQTGEGEPSPACRYALGPPMNRVFGRDDGHF